MKDDIQMSVSPITHDKNGKPQVFVQFTDGDRRAEGRIPGAKILNQTGFSSDEVAALEEYMKREKATILTMAKKIDVFAAFLGK
ncbi:MAG: hypothetical protein J5819_10175 [Eubacterium sp.]|nr:hypothetical protein [Eubacterium sp.]